MDILILLLSRLIVLQRHFYQAREEEGEQKKCAETQST
jgi:hypothetical protein